MIITDKTILGRVYFYCGIPTQKIFVKMDMIEVRHVKYCFFRIQRYSNIYNSRNLDLTQSNIGKEYADTKFRFFAFVPDFILVLHVALSR